MDSHQTFPGTERTPAAVVAELQYRQRWSAGCLEWGTGYGHRAARHRCMSRSEVEDVRMTRPVTIPGPGRQMGRAALLLPLRRHVLRAARQAQLAAPRERRVGARALETEQNDARERRPSPSLPQRRTARRERSLSASTLGFERYVARNKPATWDSSRACGCQNVIRSSSQGRCISRPIGIPTTARACSPGSTSGGTRYRWEYMISGHRRNRVCAPHTSRGRSCPLSPGSVAHY
jgi:hypothetical protein